MKTCKHKYELENVEFEINDYDGGDQFIVAAVLYCKKCKSIKPAKAEFRKYDEYADTSNLEVR